MGGLSSRERYISLTTISGLLVGWYLSGNTYGLAAAWAVMTVVVARASTRHHLLVGGAILLTIGGGGKGEGGGIGLTVPRGNQLHLLLL